jgi:hypothetical protein
MPSPPGAIPKLDLGLDNASCTQQAKATHVASFGLSEHVMELTDSLHGLLINANNEIAKADAGTLGRSFGRHVHNQQTLLLFRASSSPPFLRQRNFLHHESEIGPSDVTAIEQFLEYPLYRDDW